MLQRLKPKDFATVKASVHVRGEHEVAHAAAITAMLSGGVNGIGSDGGSSDGGVGGGGRRSSQRGASLGSAASDPDASSSTAITEFGLLGTEVKFVLDDGEVMQGVEEALLTMRQNEVAELKVFPPYFSVVELGSAAGRSASAGSAGSTHGQNLQGRAAPGFGGGGVGGGGWVPATPGSSTAAAQTASAATTTTATATATTALPAEHITVVVHLLDFENPPDTWELLFSQKVERMTELRQWGNDMFKRKQYERALRRYTAALGIFKEPLDVQTEQQAVEDASLPCHLNSAACFLKLEDWGGTVESCNAALELSPGDPKGLYRRGVANTKLADYDAAKHDLSRCLSIQPENKLAQTAMKRLAAVRTAQYKKDTAAFQGMFGGKPLIPAIRPGTGASDDGVDDEME